MRFTQPSSARTLNRLRALNLIATNDNLSRADIARALNLNKVSTSEIVNQLIKEELVYEKGLTTTAVGRPPTALLLNKDSQMVLAIELTSRATNVALVNLKGELLRFERQPALKEPTKELLAATIINLANKFTSKMRESSLIKALAISLNAEVDNQQGTIISHFEWDLHHFNLAEVLAMHLDYPIILENNVKAMGLGYKWFNTEEDNYKTLFVNWADEIQVAYLDGGNILLDNSLIAHIPMANSGVCRCGAVGCLETQAAGWSFLETYPEATSLRELNNLSKTDNNIENDILNGSEYLALALIYTASLIRCEKILINTIFDQRFFNSLKATFARKAPKELKQIELELTPYKEQIGIMGTGALALDQIIFRRSLVEQIKTASL